MGFTVCFKFNFTITYHPGTQHTKPDALSQLFATTNVPTTALILALTAYLCLHFWWTLMTRDIK